MGSITTQSFLGKSAHKSRFQLSALCQVCMCMYTAFYASITHMVRQYYSSWYFNLRPLKIDRLGY